MCCAFISDAIFVKWMQTNYLPCQCSYSKFEAKPCSLGLRAAQCWGIVCHICSRRGEHRVRDGGGGERVGPIGSSPYNYSHQKECVFPWQFFTSCLRTCRTEADVVAVDKQESCEDKLSGYSCWKGPYCYIKIRETFSWKVWKSFVSCFIDLF